MFGQKATYWEFVLTQAEFGYNNSPNRSTRYSPFRICTKYEAHISLALAPLSPMFRVSALAIEFVTHIQQVHVEIHQVQTNRYALVKLKFINTVESSPFRSEIGY